MKHELLKDFDSPFSIDMDLLNGGWGIPWGEWVKTPSTFIPNPSTKHSWAMNVFYLNLVVSIALVVGGFFVPPVGVIDESVLTAVGLLLMFSVVDKFPEAIRAGRNIKISKGDFPAEIDSD